MKQHYDADIIIVGGGAIGLATALEAAKRGQSVIVFEQYTFGNQNGSSAGHVRMWRTAITEPSHVAMALEAGKLYHDLEQEAGEKLLYKKGLLNFGVETDYTAQGTIETAVEVLKEFGHHCIRYDKSQLESRFPFKNLPENYFGIYHAENAVIDVKTLMSSLVSLNKTHGVTLLENSPVTQISSEANGVAVESNGHSYSAKKMLLSPGPFANKALSQFGFKINFLFWEMAFAYYKIEDPSLEFPMWFQFDYPDESTPSKLFYGFPPMSFARDGFVRLAVDWASHTFDSVEQRKRIPRDLDINMTREYIQKYMRGVSDMPIDMTAAVHPQTPDNLSVLDFMPQEYVPYNNNILLFTGGWAFKFVPLLGKICAEMLCDGQTTYDISELAVHREGLISSL